MIVDRIKYQSTTFDIIKSKGEMLFVPSSVGLKVTSLYSEYNETNKGYACTYCIKKNKLNLERVYVGLTKKDQLLTKIKMGPVISGQKPRLEIALCSTLCSKTGELEHSFQPGSWYFEFDNYPIDFTGEILIGTYNDGTIYEMTLDKGCLLTVKNRPEKYEDPYENLLDEK